MTDLVACHSTGKGTWTHVSRLMAAAEWSKVFLVCTAFGKARFTSERPFEFVVVNDEEPLQLIAESIASQLKGKFSDLEVAVNLISGSGKEHMAVLSALQKAGVGWRLVLLDDAGKVQEA